MDSCGESFFFYGLTNFFLFSILAWRTWVIRVRVILLFVFVYPKYLAFGSIHHEPCPKTDFSYYLFPLTGRSPHFRFGVPANHLASLFFLLVSGDLSEVTKYQHQLVSPLWPTFFLNGHSLTACYCSLKRENSINLISIVSVGHHVTFRINVSHDNILSHDNSSCYIDARLTTFITILSENCVKYMKPEWRTVLIYIYIYIYGERERERKNVTYNLQYLEKNILSMDSLIYGTTIHVPKIACVIFGHKTVLKRRKSLNIMSTGSQPKHTCLNIG